ncbi:FKBP-type peptidyl-prolyl cis-trans isomerase [Christiangramia salexigens]|uniref:peptidylprolyl isomerase n=1 Tax=Christiangramia salexigens TaxID=1913577 RepID=A0A1L3J1E4_9FLAO|nr:hypothetical protein [Christiangramia salexigens]APG58940.1 hypothetical protein LPB144_00305 [Christiangramia salexigens]
MRLNKLMMICLLAFIVFSCNKDDDNPEPTPPRDRGEQAIADDQALIDYLSTHFYNYEEFENPSENFDYVVRFDTIAGDNSDKTPIIDSDKLLTKTVNYQGVDQLLYVLKVREGEGPKPAATDSTLVGYKGELLNSSVFDSNLKSPLWFNLSGYQVRGSNGGATRVGNVIEGFGKGLSEFRASTGFTLNSDNSVEWNNDYGIGALFIPSGLGYFSSPRPSIPAYSPLIFTFKLYRVNEADHDGDGIPSYMEDLDGDGDVFNDDSDEDGLSNHSDADDDGDGTPTRKEIIINEDGSIEFPDSNNNGIPDYLDPDTFQ